MSDTFKIELSRTRAIAACVCVAAAGVLLFVAGTASGLLLASSATGRQTTAQVAPPQPLYKSIPDEKTAPAPAPEQTPVAASASASDQSGNPPSLAVIPAAPKAVASPATPAAAPSAPSPEPSVPSQPSAAPANSNQPPAGPSEAAVSPAAPNPATWQNGEGDGPSLAVKVCSFSGKLSAESLASSLESKGYHASVVRAVGAQGRTWYVVTMGPYREWNTATTAAARVAVLANVQPVVGELR